MTRIVDLKTNGLIRPLTIEESPVIFSWRMEADRTGAMQKDFRIRVYQENTLLLDSGVQEKEAASFAADLDLRPTSQYRWVLDVTDDEDVSHTKESFFETSLFNDFGKAKWIGSPEAYFSAYSAGRFDIEAALQILEGDWASFVIGADDHRLAHANMNPWGSAAASALIYTVVAEAEPYLMIASAGYPEHVLAKAPLEGFRREEPFTIRLHTLSSFSQVTCLINGKTVDENRAFNSLGSGQNYNSFPNLAKIGFAVPETGKMLVSYLTLRLPSRFEEKAIRKNFFDIFLPHEGVSLSEEGMLVEGTEIKADPSSGSMPLLRKTFHLEETPLHAVLYVTALGIYEARLNGRPVGNARFTPGLDEYFTEMPYQAFDVTDLLAKDNTLDVQLGEGWWCGDQTFTAANHAYYGSQPALKALLRIETGEKTITIVSEPETWLTGTSPVRFASNYHGEVYDATVTPQFAKAVEVQPRQPIEKYVTRYEEAAHVTRTLPAVYLHQTGETSWVYDFGENVTGVPCLHFKDGDVNAGDTLILRYAEILYPDLPEYREKNIVGHLMTENLRAALVTDFYTAKDGDQTFEPTLTFRGFRYLEITGLSKPLAAEQIERHVLSSIEITSSFDCDSPLINRLFRNVQNSAASNFFWIPTDCPQRNERMGWTGDAQVFAGAVSYHADVYNFYRSWLRTIRACAGKDGSIPVTVPPFIPQAEHGDSEFAGISWDFAIFQIPYVLYQATGYPQIIEENFAMMEKYLAYLAEEPYEEHLTKKTGILADWLSLDPVSPELVNNAVYVRMLEMAAEFAGILGQKEKQEFYEEKHAKAKETWNRIYTDEEGRTRTPGGMQLDFERFMPYMAEAGRQETETSYATPLYCRVFRYPEQAAGYLAEQVRKAGYHITSGFSGTPYLLPMLTKSGYDEEAAKLFEQTEYASWLYPVINGATSVWERWNSYTLEGGFNGNNAMNSFNHFSLGAVSEWMDSALLGITHRAPSWQRFILRPHTTGTLNRAEGSVVTPYGRIVSGWEKKGSTTSYHFVIPANTTARIYLPASASSFVMPHGLRKVGISLSGSTACIVLEALSGEYTLTVR